MNNKVFLDSSILVKWAKKTHIELSDYLATTSTYTLCISQIVLSEFTYYRLAIEGKKSPVTRKRDGSISQILEDHSPANLLTKLTFLESDSDVLPLYLRYMEQYNLLPNDALILATCKLNGIAQIASYDADFAPACLGEEIHLVQQISDLI